MVELSSKRVDQILHEETQKTEPLPMILRGIYTRYMHLYERYFADIKALDEDKIAELRKYHEETKSLVKYYYMDIPQDICIGIHAFEEKSSEKLLGPGWHDYLFDNYAEFVEYNEDRDLSEERLRAEYAVENLKAFYEEMGSVFREGFGTDSKTAEKFVNEISGLLFGQ